MEDKLAVSAPVEAALYVEEKTGKLIDGLFFTRQESIMIYTISLKNSLKRTTIKVGTTADIKDEKKLNLNFTKKR
jgi:hypothetical protein